MIAMEKDCYQEIIVEVSNKLSEKFISTENNLLTRSILHEFQANINDIAFKSDCPTHYTD
jgi:hypothetical protein